jgi:hypothetical protein
VFDQKLAGLTKAEFSELCVMRMYASTWMCPAPAAALQEQKIGKQAASRW